MVTISQSQRRGVPPGQLLAMLLLLRDPALDGLGDLLIYPLADLVARLLGFRDELCYRDENILGDPVADIPACGHGFPPGYRCEMARGWTG